MTRIVYTVKEGQGVLRSFSPGGASLVDIRVEGVTDGILSFGPKSARLKGGVCRISLSPLLDGDYTPKLTVDGEMIYLDEVRKRGNNLTRPPIKAEILDRLYKRVDELEGLTKSLTADIADLKKKVDSPFVITNQA